MYTRVALFYCVLQLTTVLIFASNSKAVESENPNYLLGQKFFLKGNFSKAKKYLEKSLTYDPNHTASHYAIAKIHFLLKDSVSAFEFLRNTLSLQKNYKDSRALFNETLESIRKNYEPNTKNPRLLSAQIYLDFKSGRTEIAKRQIDQLISTHPDFAMGWDHLANYYYRQKDLDKALIYLKKAMGLDPTNPTIFKHYESTYYLKNHKITPKNRIKSASSKKLYDDSMDNVLIDRFIAKEMAKNESLNAKQIDIGESSNVDFESKIEANDNNFFNKLLSKQSKLIPPKKKKINKKKKPKKEISENKYQPIPVSKIDRNVEQIDLIKRAQEAYDEKNWVLAATSYGILHENNPKEKLFELRFEESKKFDQFERKYRKARLFMQKGKKNPSQLDRAKEEFQKLDTRLYYKLYQKSSFDNYLASIAFTQRRFEEAEVLFRSWLRYQPKDLNAHYFLLLCLDTLKKHDESYEIYSSAIAIDGEKFISLKGIKKIRLKIYLYRYWPILLIFLGIWGLLTFIYAGVKFKKRSERSDRKNKLQNVRNLGADKNWLEMIKSIDKLLLETSDESERYNLQYMKANALYQSTQLINAERQIDSLLVKSPNDQQLIVLKGKVLLGQKRTDLIALEPYRLLIIKDPTNLELMKTLLQTLKQQNIFTSETESVALRILEIESYNKETLRDLTEIYVKSETYHQQSCEIMRRYLEIFTGESLVLLHYVKALVRTENYIEAIRNGKKLIDINPDIEEAHRQLIEAFDRLNMTDEMNSYYSNLSLEFGSSKVVQQMYNMIQVTYKSTGYDRAEFTNEQKLEITEIAFNEGINLLHKKAYKEATIKFQTAVAAEKYYFRGHLLSVEANLALDDFESACFYFNKLSLEEYELDKEALEIIYSMANRYQIDKQNSEALRLFQLIAKNDIDFKNVIQKIDLLSTEN